LATPLTNRIFFICIPHLVIEKSEWRLQSVWPCWHHFYWQCRLLHRIVWT